MFSKQKILEIEEKAKKEIQEEAQKAIKAYCIYIEDEIYKKVKIDIAENQKMTLDEYEFEMFFNPRNSKEFATKRSYETGLTDKELMYSVKDELEKLEYKCTVVKNKLEEESNLNVVLKIK